LPYLFLLFSYFETFSCVLAEALCSGIPVIATNAGGIPEFVNSKNGIYVNGSRIHGSATLNELDIVRLGSALFQWKEYIHKPQVRITDPPTKPYSPPNPPYQPPYSPQPPIPQKQQNYTPIIIFAIILVFFGLAYLIVDANDNDRNSVPPVIVAPKPTNETDNQTKVEPVERIFASAAWVISPSICQAIVCGFTPVSPISEVPVPKVALK
jgi:hypothetical protein